jgi:hypothetical protein
MTNFNPKSPDVLLAAYPEPGAALRLRGILDGADSRPEVRVIDVEIGSGRHVYVVRLVTDRENLACFWTLNFPAHLTNRTPDGIIWFIADADDPAATEFLGHRHYLPDIEQIICFNNDFYRNLKMSYRGLTANLALRDGLVSLHSAAVRVGQTSVVITGDSGAGKSTLLKHILNDLGGTLIWDDWGFVDTHTLALCDPNEDYNHMKVSSLRDLVPDFSFPDFGDTTRCHTEFLDPESRFPEQARIMVRLKDHLPSVPSGQEPPFTLDTLIIIRNDRHRGHSIEEIDPATALEVFFTPVQSRAFGYEIRCFNGSLLMAGGLAQRHRDLAQRLFERIDRILLINNNYSGMDYDSLNALLTRNHPSSFTPPIQEAGEPRCPA